MSTIPDTKDTDMVRRRYINPPPSADDATAAASITTAKREFAKRLQHLMTEKGWNQSDMARAAAKFMPDKKFNRDNVSLYVRAQQLPGPVRLRAMCRALGVEESALIPPGAVATVDEGAPPLALRPIDASTVWLQINQAVPQDVAMKIIALLGTATGAKK
ncbi:helix-turn-helix domain-containing protein [Bradyrhizobium neotropicale]|uniref:helix-turn-helix domain-containing protein n=1 Tax=Bradyrhizobium neotropicale TaxID=1497615 RepID=UPI001AD789F5|nr:helix-turn-helix domain-containing protein [Bradyrhizobium neotropicale]MBO4228001.1 helix-turn-helix domain-containing protein [Bradyrhizobium neotropicale]